VADEISGGSPAPRPARTVLFVLVLAALVIAGVVSLRRGRPEPAAAPTPTPIPPAFSYDPGPPVVPPPVGALALRGLCAVRSDYRTTLEVEFALENTTAVPATLVSVTPLLPLAGLRVRGTALRGGTCRDRGPARTAGAVPGRGIVVVTFRLGLPPTCPQALPVQATVRDRSARGDLTSQVTLLSDLGGIRFETC
jgi:hypothetical protein